MYTINIKPKSVFRAMLGFIAVLLILHLLGAAFTFITGHNSLFGILQFVSMDHEMSLPTFFSTCELLFASGLLWLIGRFHKTSGERHVAWWGLAGIFLYLAIDEYAGVHEMLVIPLREALHLKGILYLAWYIPYGAGLIVLAFIYRRFLMDLPRSTRLRFLVAAFVYVTGAIGFEALSGRQYYYHGYQNLVYIFYMTTEETLEMMGMALFVYALLLYLAPRYPAFSVHMKHDESKSVDTH